MFYCFLREQLKNDLDEIVSISRLWAAKTIFNKEIRTSPLGKHKSFGKEDHG